MRKRDDSGAELKTPLARYGLAVGGAVVAGVLRLPFEPLLEGKAPFALFYLPVVIVAWYAGTIPTILTTVLSFLIAWYVFVPAYWSFQFKARADIASLALFLVVCGVLTAISRAASSLRKRAGRLAAIVESSEDPIISKNLDGMIETWNAAAEQLFGYSPSEAVGKPITILVPSEKLEEEATLLRRIRSGEHVEHLETLRRTKDGRLVDVSLTISPLRDSFGRIAGASKILKDITARKHAERALAEQREWFRVTLSSIGDAVIASDRDGRITFMNTIAETLTGWTMQEVEGRPLATVFHIINEKTREPVENPSEKVIRTGRILGLANHTVLISRDGTERPITDSAAPILDDREKILGVVVVFHDVTEERRTAAALAEHRKWFETTLESIGDAVIATDINRRVIFMNPVAEYLTGWKLDQVEGRPSPEVFHIVNEQTRREVEDPISRVLREGVVVGLANHTVLIAKDGVERPIDDSGAPIRDRDGRIVGAVLVFRDVTERRNTEAAKHALSQERERLLASERVARAEAERANRLKDDFVATLSHELRTPLTAILGWTQVVRRTPENADLVMRGIDVIERNTWAQSRLVSDLLDVSRIIAGKLRLEMQPTDLASIVRQAVETPLAAAGAKGITITQHLEKVPDDMLADPARLQQIVWNLVTNAVKFTPKGGQIDVVLREVGNDAQIVVRDSGIGIKPEFLSRLFHRFTQAEGSASRRFGGLGLGLAIVNELVHLHGGTVIAESEGEGRGSTFTVQLPIVAPQTSSLVRASSEPPSSLSASEGAKLCGIRILVVEDDDDARELIQRLLEDFSAVVTTASTGPEALKAFSKDRPNVIVSDIGLPGMDGYELIRRIRAQGAGVPAIALTAFAGVEDRARALRAGYQAHVPKPIDAREFIAVVASFVDLIAPGTKQAQAVREEHALKGS